MSNSDSSMTGTTLAGRYQIGSLLGKGGAGAVYKALDLQTNETVAVKLLIASGDYEGESISSRSMQQQYFQREVGLLQRVSHPNIIRVLDSGVNEEEQNYLVMEYAEGVTLRDLMRSGQMTLARAARILRQIGAALQAIHDQGIIHRDFKPHNVIVTGSGGDEVAKLLDFGIAKMIRGSTDEAFLKTLTAKGVIAGTLQYMSPEQCQGRKLDERTDIYSMGVTAYEMVSGKLPFNSRNAVSLIMLHLETPPPPLKQVPSRVEEVIMKALKKSPDQRYGRAIEFAQAFAAAVNEAEGNTQSVIRGDGSAPDAETRAFDNSGSDHTIELENRPDSIRNETREIKRPGLWDAMTRMFGKKRS